MNEDLVPVWQGICWDGWQDFGGEAECLRYTKAVLGDKWEPWRVRKVWMRKEDAEL